MNAKYTCENIEGNRCKKAHGTLAAADKHAEQLGGRKVGWFVMPLNNAARTVLQREAEKEYEQDPWF